MYDVPTGEYPIISFQPDTLCALPYTTGETLAQGKWLWPQVPPVGDRLQPGKRAKAQDKQEIAAVESELAMLAAQLAAIRKLRKK